MKRRLQFDMFCKDCGEITLEELYDLIIAPSVISRFDMLRLLQEVMLLVTKRVPNCVQVF